MATTTQRAGAIVESVGKRRRVHGKLSGKRATKRLRAIAGLTAASRGLVVHSDPGHKGRPGQVGGSTPGKLLGEFKADTGAHAGIRIVAKDVVDAWKYHGEVSVLDDEGPIFERGGLKWKEGANCQLATGKVVIHANSGGTSTQTSWGTDYVKRMVAHELMHGTYEKVHQQYTIEQEDIGISENIDDIIKPSGELRPGYETTYPTYAKMWKFEDGAVDKLRDEDGVTDYSKAYWKDFTEGKGVTYHIAVHETLAEIAGMHETTGVINGSKLYRDFYKAIRDEYRILTGHKRRPKPKQLAVVNAGKQSISVMYFDSDRKPTTADHAAFIREWFSDGSHRWGWRAPAPTANSKPERYDPSRTILLRKAFTADITRRMNSILQAVYQALVKDDAFTLNADPGHAGRPGQVGGSAPTKTKDVPEFDEEGSYPLFHVTKNYNLKGIKRVGIGTPENWDPASGVESLKEDGTVSWTRDPHYAIDSGDVRLVIKNKQSLIRKGVVPQSHIGWVATSTLGEDGPMVPATWEHEEVTRGVVPYNEIDEIHVPQSVRAQWQKTYENYSNSCTALEEQLKNSTDLTPRKKKLYAQRLETSARVKFEYESLLNDPKIKVVRYLARKPKTDELRVINADYGHKGRPGEVGGSLPNGGVVGKASLEARVKAWMDSMDTKGSEAQTSSDPRASHEDHANALAGMSNAARKLNEQAHKWEESKPWNSTVEQVKAGNVPGFSVGSYGGRGQETAHHEDGQIVLTPKFFQLSSEQGRRGVIWHELGHQLSDTMLQDGSAFKLVDSNAMPEELDGQTTPGEILAQAYSLLHDDLPYFRKNAPKLVQHVVDRAKALHMPLPEEVRNTYNPLEKRDTHGKWTKVGDNTEVELANGIKITGNTNDLGAITEHLDLDIDEVIGLVGAQPGAHVRVTSVHTTLGMSYAHVETTHPGYQSKRTLYKDHIENDEIEVNKKGAGLGTKILYDQVNAAAALKKEYISTQASRGDGVNGYYTWARLGYDGKLKGNLPREDVIDALSKFQFSDQVNPKISDLMKTAEGRDWWKEKGVGFAGTFDLTEGSLSRRVLDTYVKEKSKVQNEADPELMESDEQILDRIWDNLRKAENVINVQLGNRSIIVLLWNQSRAGCDSSLRSREWGLQYLGLPGEVQTLGKTWQVGNNLRKLDNTKLDVSSSIQVANVKFTGPDDKKIEAFRKWLDQQVSVKLAGNDGKDQWWDKYIKQAYRKGAERSYTDAKGVHSPDKQVLYQGAKGQFLSTLSVLPTAKTQVQLLASRTFTDLKGITGKMSNAITRALVDGVIQGKTKEQIAQGIHTVVGVDLKRASAIAQHNISMAFAEGQLTALEMMGHTHVGALVEWHTSGLGTTAKGNPSPCKLCKPLARMVIPIKKARGMIPRHVGCLCCWVATSVGEIGVGGLGLKKRKVSQASVQKAIDKSVEGELPMIGKGKKIKTSKRRLAMQKAKSPWVGAQLKLKKPTTNEQSLVPALLVNRMEVVLERVEQVVNGGPGSGPRPGHVAAKLLADHLTSGSYEYTDPQKFRSAYTDLDDSEKVSAAKHLHSVGLLHPLDERKRTPLTASTLYESAKGQYKLAKERHEAVPTNRHTPFTESEAHKKFSSLTANKIHPTIEQAASHTELNPSPAKVNAGNYRKGKINIHGLIVTIENPRGSTRTKVGGSGNIWSRVMQSHYGYFNRSEAVDGDHVDVFVGPDHKTELAFVIDQHKKDGSYDEPKCMLGFPTEKAAREGYLANYPKGWTGLGKITAMTIPTLREWLAKQPHGDAEWSAITGNAFCPSQTQNAKDEKGHGSEKGWHWKSKSVSDHPKPKYANSTRQAFQYPNGMYTNERHDLHKKIVSGIVDGVMPVERPTAFLLGGGSGAGKSTLIDSGLMRLPDNMASISNDSIKEELPEYQYGVKHKLLGISMYVHDEASDITKMASKNAVQNKLNLLLDGTGDGGYGSLLNRVNKIRSNGHTVIAHYVTVPTDIAIKRVAERAKKTGRSVPENVVRKNHEDVSRILPKAVEDRIFDEVHLWDNSGEHPEPVMSQILGVTTIHSPELWREFLHKDTHYGREQHSPIKSDVSGAGVHYGHTIGLA